MNRCGPSWAKGLFINTFMPINCKKPNGKSYLGHKKQSASRSLTFTPEWRACSCALCIFKMDFTRVPKQTRSGRDCLRACWNSGFGGHVRKAKTNPGRELPSAWLSTNGERLTWNPATHPHPHRPPSSPPLAQSHSWARHRGGGWRMKSCGSLPSLKRK